MYVKHFTSFFFNQALIGVAFSLGFIIGPLVGAMFSIWGKQHSMMDEASSFTAFQYPALFALAMATIDVVFLMVFFQESLLDERRVSFTSTSTSKRW